jgi:selenide,water dikinase
MKDWDMTETGGSHLWEGSKAGGCARKLEGRLVRELVPWLAGDSDRFMEDAAILRIGDSQLIQSIDFLTSLVPDAGDFGRIAAANALSDIYVTGGWPLFALAVACVPLGSAFDEFAEALHAGRQLLLEGGCELVGGHSVVDDEAKLGFAITGKVNQSGQLIGSRAIAGDSLLLTKPLGVGIITSAYKAGRADQHLLSLAIDEMSELNDCVPRLLESPLATSIHAATDVTGYGLLGHAFELCRRSGVGVALDLHDIPTIEGVRELARSGVCTSAAVSNAEYVNEVCTFDIASLELADRLILTDPQTSGGALMAIAGESIQKVVALLELWDVHAAVIGHISSANNVSLV